MCSGNQCRLTQVDLEKGLLNGCLSGDDEVAVVSAGVGFIRTP